MYASSCRRFLTCSSSTAKPNRVRKKICIHFGQRQCQGLSPAQQRKFYIITLPATIMRYYFRKTRQFESCLRINLENAANAFFKRVIRICYQSLISATLQPFSSHPPHPKPSPRWSQHFRHNFPATAALYRLTTNTEHYLAVANTNNHIYFGSRVPKSSSTSSLHTV